MRPSRVLGQNFLIDKNLLDYIVREAHPEPGEIVLEAGPGFGALTRLLLAAGAELYAIEFDRRLCDYLRNNIKEPNFHLTENDACRVDIASILPEGRPFRAIANLPYAISSIFVGKLLDLPSPPVQMIFMLQKEMAQRLAARPGTKNYGALSVRSQQLYDVKLLRTVPPQVFHPRPEVDSALVKFEATGYLPDFELRKRLCGIVRCVFAQRRKMLLKPLAAAYGREKVEAALQKAGISESARPAELDIKQYEQLAAFL